MAIFVPSTTTLGVTASDWIEETRRHLGAGSGETLNQLEATDAIQTTVTFKRSLKNITPGVVLSVGLEQMYVWDTVASDKTVDVVRGYGSSVRSAHADDALVRVGHPHSDFAIFSALNAELASLNGAGIYSPRVADLTAAGNTATYNLAPDVQDVYVVLEDNGSDYNEWPEVRSWSFRPSMPEEEFASGNSLRLDSRVGSGNTIRVLYKASLGRLSSLEDDVETATGLLPSALDLPPLGAAWRLAMPEEYRRNQTHRQGDSRRAEEVPPGAKLRAPAGLAQVRQTRRREEAINLAALWPSRRRSHT